MRLPGVGVNSLLSLRKIGESSASLVLWSQAQGTGFAAYPRKKPLIGEPFARLGFLFKIKTCEKFYHRRPVGSAYN
jgi:hypothetical protein